MHVGVGAFHRAHQAVYVDQLLDQHPEWGICGVNLRAEDRPLFDALKAQQGSYVLKTMSATGDTEFREIGSIVELIDASAHYADAVSRAADPAIRIVSMTVTESGYNLDEHDVLDLSAASHRRRSKDGHRLVDLHLFACCCEGANGSGVRCSHLLVL